MTKIETPSQVPANDEPGSEHAWPLYSSSQTAEVSVVSTSTDAEVPVVAEQGESLSRSEKIVRGLGWAATGVFGASLVAIGYGGGLNSHEVGELGRSVGTRIMLVSSSVGSMAASQMRLRNWKRKPKDVPLE